MLRNELTDLMKDMEITDESICEELVRSGVQIAIVENRELPYDHIPGGRRVSAGPSMRTYQKARKRGSP